MNEKALKLLQMFYKGASRKIVQTINSSTDFSRDRKQSILKEVDTILTDLEKNTKKWVNREVETSYKLGSNQAVNLLSTVNITLKSKFNKIDEEAIKAIADDTFMSFAESISGVKRATSKLLDQATKERLRALIAEGKISGETRKQIANNIAGELKHGFVALKDKSGKTWSIENYASMLADTKLNEAVNQGRINRLSDEGYDLVQVTDHGTNCNLCGKWEGEILSISGKSSEYKSVAEAEADGLMHPHCKHQYVPYHEEFAKQSKEWSTDLQKYI
jgi:ribosomal protein S13